MSHLMDWDGYIDLGFINLLRELKQKIDAFCHKNLEKDLVFILL